jgi:hypothetical protein
LNKAVELNGYSIKQLKNFEMWFNIIWSEGYILQEEQQYGNDVVYTSSTSVTYFLGCFLGWLHVFK